jgi:hypothetical protein
MPRCRLAVQLSVLVTFGTSFTAHASGVTLVGQDRRVAGSALVTTPLDFDSESQQFAAPDEGPFDAAAIASALVDGASASATSTQNSSITPFAVHAAGSYDATAEVGVEGGTAYTACQTNVALRFAVPEATTYALEGFLEAFDDGYTTVQFSRPFLTVEFFSASEERLDLQESGVIEAGTYDLNVTASGGANAESGAADHVAGAYDLHLILGGATGAPAVASGRIVAAPNPFSTETRLVLPEHAGPVRIVDLAGRVVRTLAGGEPRTWDGRDDAGRALGAGVYWVRAEGLGSEPLKVVRVR